MRIDHNQYIEAVCKEPFYDEEAHEITFKAGHSYKLIKLDSNNFPYLAIDKNGNKKLFTFVNLKKHFGGL